MRSRCSASSRFDIYGTTAYIYSVVVLFVAVLARARASCIRRSVSSCAASARTRCACRRSAPRCNARLVAVYTIGAAYAGIAGALLAQTTQFVVIDVLGFPRSAELLLILVLGGTGQALRRAARHDRVHGRAGPAVRTSIPQYWQFWLGLLLVLVVLFARGGIMGGARRARRAVLPRDEAANDDATRLQTAQPRQEVRRLRRHRRRHARTSPPGARHALIGPNGAGKTTLINLLTGVSRADAGEVILGGDDVTALAQHERVKRGLARTFQINRLFADMTVLESVMLAVCERAGLRRALVAAGRRARAKRSTRRRNSSPRLRLADVANERTTQPRLRQAAPGRDRAGAGRAAARAAARRAGRRRSDRREPRAVRDASPRCRARSRSS